MFKILRHRALEGVKRVSFSTSPYRFEAEVIDGKKLAEEALNQLKTDIEEFVKLGNTPPKLAAMLVGNNPASQSYVKIKMKAAKKVGIGVEMFRCPDDIDEESLLRKIHDLNNNHDFDGILVQLPLPSHLSERNVCNLVSPDKDVDGFNIANIGRLCLNMTAMIPCTARAVYYIIKRIVGSIRTRALLDISLLTENRLCPEGLWIGGVETVGKTAVVCGRSKNVGMPIALMLHSQGGKPGGGMDATTTICHRYTPSEELAKLTRSADIVVSAAGVPKLIRGDMIKEGACVIDVGMTRLIDDTTKKAYFVGDVDFDEVVKVAGYVTPVPGGVGPVTVAMLMMNTFRACFLKQNRIFTGLL